MSTLPIVLVVDDDEPIRDILRLVLEDEGYAVLVAVDGEALWMAAAARPAVIILDVIMPGMDGVEVCRRLRADPATAAIPVIATSAGRTLTERVREMHADATLAKPFDLDDVVALVARLAVEVHVAA